MSGVLHHNPSEIIAQLLADLGIADRPDDEDSLTEWTVFSIHLPETPEQAILVSDTAGRLHRRIHVTGVTGEHYGIQFLARSSEDPSTPYKKMKALLDLIDTEVRLEQVVLDEYTYRVNALTRTSPAIPAGRDGGRFLYSGNALASIELVSINTGTGS